MAAHSPSFPAFSRNNYLVAAYMLYDPGDPDRCVVATSSSFSFLSSSARAARISITAILPRLMRHAFCILMACFSSSSARKADYFIYIDILPVRAR